MQREALEGQSLIVNRGGVESRWIRSPGAKGLLGHPNQFGSSRETMLFCRVILTHFAASIYVDQDPPSFSNATNDN